MKFEIILLIALAMICALLACLAWNKLSQENRKISKRVIRRHGVRPFNAMERFALLWIVPMQRLAGLSHRVIGGDRIALANYIAQTAGDEDTKLSDAAIGRRMVVKLGSDENHIALCTSADVPLGATGDASADAAESRLSFKQFGLYHRELEGTADGAIAAGDMLVPGTVAGTLRKLPTAAGTYYICGRAKIAAADTKAIVYVPCFPIQRVVA